MTASHDGTVTSVCHSIPVTEIRGFYLDGPSAPGGVRRARWPRVRAAAARDDAPAARAYVQAVRLAAPRAATPVALLLSEDAWETHLLIGHENSPLHGKTKFQI